MTAGAWIATFNHMKNATAWATGDVARDLRDGETVEVLSAEGCSPGFLWLVKILVAGRGGPSGPSALAGESTWRDLNDPDYPFERFEVAA